MVPLRHANMLEVGLNRLVPCC